jgi:two-component system NtrC family sensor kinase
MPNDPAGDRLADGAGPHPDPPSASSEDHRQAHYRRLFRRFVLLTMVCSFLPLLIVGWGINLYYSRFARERMINDFRNEVAHHRRIIELFLKERRTKLQLIAGTVPKDQLTDPARLNEVFEMINREYWSITDLGIIDGDGRHLAYVGPYDLMDKNYAETFWFKAVMEKGIYISDMFMGFRQEPHFIIAVTHRDADGGRWILRATVDTEAFRSLVENVRIGQTGEVYLINSSGNFQTSPRRWGRIMGLSPIPVENFHEGIQLRTVEPRSIDGHRIPRQIMCQTWLEQPRWMLVVQQDHSEALRPVRVANLAALVFLHLAALSILAVAVLITRHMINVIKRRDTEADQLNRQLMQTSKMASIGELSAGVAHEINNPLAIIGTECQLMRDCAQHTAAMDPAFAEQFDQSINQINVQIQRCKRITTNLLRFSRRTRSMIETVDLNEFIREVIDLMEREARSSGIKFFAELDDQLPPVLSDPSQLQQVFLNLITNAIDAHDDKPYGSITIGTRNAPAEGGIRLTVSDSGCGIPYEALEKIFDPFFTTKPVGRGTGLGLSICFSIIRRLGGTVDVASRPGQGTTFTVFLPYQPPAEVLENIEIAAHDQLSLSARSALPAASKGGPP